MLNQPTASNTKKAQNKNGARISLFSVDMKIKRFNDIFLHEEAV